MTNLDSLYDLFKAAMKLAAACAFATAIAAAAGQTNHFVNNGNARVGTTSPTVPFEVRVTAGADTPTL
ncbi:MAG TPA: hypothetical protein VGW32_01640, partial [Pyrinomonadaceae bacterium]|nr:hypothetical protein [Pyrinomonadaceae bacterium]